MNEIPNFLTQGWTPGGYRCLGLGRVNSWLVVERASGRT